MATARADLQALHDQDTKLNQEVSALQVYERRYAEFQQEMAALNKQLETLQDHRSRRQGDRRIHAPAARRGGRIGRARFARLTAEAVVSRDYHFEMPFQIQVDGPYYDIVDFFARLSRLSRIINVGDLKFDSLAGVKSPYPVRPTTTVTGTCTITTFFTTERVRRAARRRERSQRAGPRPGVN